MLTQSQPNIISDSRPILEDRLSVLTPLLKTDPYFLLIFQEEMFDLLRIPEILAI